MTTARPVLVTDSNAQLPAHVAAAAGITVVPLSISVGEAVYTEGVDLDADRFWQLLGAGAAPRVTTAAPSPGRFAEAYARLAAEGAATIVSIHVGAELSGTVNSARLAAETAGVPVRVVDSGTASFMLAGAVLEAAAAAADGAGVDETVAVAQAAAAATGNVSIFGGLELARAGGRLAGDAPSPGDAIPVVSLAGGSITVVGSVRDAGEAADMMADHVRAAGPRLRCGIGHADAPMAALADLLEGRLRAAGAALSVDRYRVGPSVGVHTGPGTVGVVFYPAAVTGRSRPAG